MLTGDARKVADHVAADLGIDEVHAELLPADKVSKVEELLAQKPDKGKLAFVGDGINDAPVLSRADIGIAMGAMHRPHGRRSAEDRESDPDLPEVPPHRIRKHLVRHWHQTRLSRARSSRYRQHVARHLRGCGRYDHRSAQRDPGTVREKTVKRDRAKFNWGRSKIQFYYVPN